MVAIPITAQNAALTMIILSQSMIDPSLTLYFFMTLSSLPAALLLPWLP